MEKHNYKKKHTYCTQRISPATSRLAGHLLLERRVVAGVVHERPVDPWQNYLNPGRTFFYVTSRHGDEN